MNRASFQELNKDLLKLQREFSVSAVLGGIMWNFWIIKENSISFRSLNINIKLSKLHSAEVQTHTALGSIIVTLSAHQALFLLLICCFFSNRVNLLPFPETIFFSEENVFYCNFITESWKKMLPIIAMVAWIYVFDCLPLTIQVLCFVGCVVSK